MSEFNGPRGDASPQTSPEKTARIELQIPASSEWVRVARLTVAGVASRLPFPVDAVEDIKLAVTEAINNAILHAPPHENPTISIEIETSAHGLWINVTDEGRLSGELPTASASWPGELPEGGLGLMLIRSLMDEVDHQSGPACDTTVRMFKRVPAIQQNAASGARQRRATR